MPLLFRCFFFRLACPMHPVTMINKVTVLNKDVHPLLDIAFELREIVKLVSRRRPMKRGIRNPLRSALYSGRLLETRRPR